MQSEISRCLIGYEGIPRRWNNKLGCVIANVTPGEYYVTKNSEMIQTTLGSCISCCVLDRANGIGGLNHFMLPDSQTSDGSGKAGNWAMEFLINDILLNGGKRNNLQVKYFGGAQLIPGLQTTAIGKRNIEFIEKYLDREKLQVVSRDVGGQPPRKILFNPLSGAVKLKKLPLKSSTDIANKEQKYSGKLVTHNSHAGEINLF